jgi:hypothetical protein
MCQHTLVNHPRLSGTPQALRGVSHRGHHHRSIESVRLDCVAHLFLIKGVGGRTDQRLQHSSRPAPARVVIRGLDAGCVFVRAYRLLAMAFHCGQPTAVAKVEMRSCSSLRFE